VPVTHHRAHEFSMPKQQPVQPVSEARLGSVEAAIWKNQSESGTRFNVRVARLYKAGGHWKSADSFGRDDLLLLAKVIDQARSKILANGKPRNG